MCHIFQLPLNLRCRVIPSVYNLFANTFPSLFLIPNEEDPIRNIIKSHSQRCKPFACNHHKLETKISESTASQVVTTRKEADVP